MEFLFSLVSVASYLISSNFSTSRSTFAISLRLNSDSFFSSPRGERIAARRHFMDITASRSLTEHFFYPLKKSLCDFSTSVEVSLAGVTSATLIVRTKVRSSEA